MACAECARSARARTAAASQLASLSASNDALAADNAALTARVAALEAQVAALDGGGAGWGIVRCT